MKIVSLFSGIGGLEYGFEKLGHNIELFCENDPAATAVLRHRHKNIRISEDIAALDELPKCDLIAAGFPCQDLSQAGAKIGIRGERSGLVSHLFRLIEDASPRPDWILVENVPYMLSLDKGHAMTVLTSSIERLGYEWCYRTVDARSFGLPQRRPRVVFLASRLTHPREIILNSSFPEVDIDGKPSDIDPDLKYGFYWTEGSRGVGWAREAVPPIKGGSAIGIPSPPAVWEPARDHFGTISIRDAERLQGFPVDWTKSVNKRNGLRPTSRWRLVGNAVNTRMSKWVASSFENTESYDETKDHLRTKGRWPASAWSYNGKVYVSGASKFPRMAKQKQLSDFLKDPLKPLSLKATNGFLSRTKVCTNVVYSPIFIDSLQKHIDSYDNSAG